MRNRSASLSEGNPIAEAIKPKRAIAPFWVGEVCIQSREIGRNSYSKCGCIFWILVLFICVCFCFYQVKTLVEAYSEKDYQVITKEVDVKELRYPDLLVCTRSALEIAQMKEDGLSDAGIQFFKNQLHKNELDRDENATYDIGPELNQLMEEYEDIENLYDAFVHFAISYDEIVGTCQVAKDELDCSSRINYGKDKADYISLRDEGICYSLSPSNMFLDIDDKKHRVMQKLPGRAGYLAVKAGLDETYCKDDCDTVKFTIVLTNLTTLVKFKTSTTIESVLGKEISVAIKERRIKKLPEPYGHCLDKAKGEQLMETLTDDDMEYTRERCQIICEAKHAMEDNERKCVAPGFMQGMKLQDTTTICTNESHIEDFDDSVLLASCEKCLPRCEYVTYDYSYSVSQMREKRAVKINLYHEDMVYNSEISKPILTFTGMMGTVGGQLSLWLGFKIATLVQMCYYTVLWLPRRIRGNRETNDNPV